MYVYSRCVCLFSLRIDEIMVLLLKRLHFMKNKIHVISFCPEPVFFHARTFVVLPFCSAKFLSFLFLTMYYYWHVHFIIRKMWTLHVMWSDTKWKAAIMHSSSLWYNDSSHNIIPFWMGNYFTEQWYQFLWLELWALIVFGVVLRRHDSNLMIVYMFILSDMNCFSVDFISIFDTLFPFDRIYFSI